MDFFGHQDTARKNTKRLVVLYFLAVVFIVVIISVLISGFVSFMELSNTAEQYRLRSEPMRFKPELLWRTEIVLPVAIYLIVLILLGTAYKLFMLRGGGHIVAESLGGTLIQANTTDLAQRRLLNVVEEMALAAGIPVPPVYLMNSENGINAFAAGYKTSDAVIGVTRGCMTLLRRDELQGVIAHEFSHILNGDMRLNIRLIGILHGILLIATTGYVLIRITSRSYSRRYSSKKGGDPRAALFIIGSILYCVGYIGVFFGKMIKSAVSRQREFLADASAVQYTRDNIGISSALAKIGGLVYGSRLEASKAEEASHMFFSNGLGASFLALLSTHPPLEERIIRLDPSFEGEFPAIDPSAKISFEETSPISQFSSHTTQNGMQGTSLELDPEQVKSSIGSPTAAHLEHVQSILAAIPPELRDATHEPFSAGALVFTLLLDDKQEIRDKQMAIISKESVSYILQQVLRFEKPVASLDANMRLPLVELCAPALKELSQAQYEEFEKVMQALIKADKSLSLFEYAVAHSVMNNLEWAFGKRQKGKTVSSLKDCQKELSIIISALSWLDTRSAKVAQESFSVGAKQLELNLEFKSKGSASLRELDQALCLISNADFKIREKIISACIAVMLTDSKITISESELLRAIASSIDCPIPPFIADH